MVRKKTKKRGEYGKGTIRESKKYPGKLELRVYYKNVEGERKRKSFVGSIPQELYSRAEIFKNVNDMRAKGINVDVSMIELLRDKFKRDYNLGITKDAAFQRNLESLKKLEGTYVGDSPIIILTADDIEIFLASLVNKYTDSTITKTYRQLKQAYMEAIRRGILSTNLIESKAIPCPRSKRETKKILAFKPDEQAKFVEGVKNHKVPYGRNNYSLQLLLELYSGARMGEINALRPEDIDFANNVIHIRGTVSRGLESKIERISHTKTDAGMRDIPMNSLARQILEEALKKMKPNPAGTIFFDFNADRVVSTSQVGCFYRRICEKLDLPYYGQHSLRHTFATRCIESGVPAVVLKDWLGHASINITLDTYADIFAKMNYDAMDAFEKYMGNVPDDAGKSPEN